MQVAFIVPPPWSGHRRFKGGLQSVLNSTTLTKAHLTYQSGRPSIGTNETSRLPTPCRDRVSSGPRWWRPPEGLAHSARSKRSDIHTSSDWNIVSRAAAKPGLKRTTLLGTRKWAHRPSFDECVEMLSQSGACQDERYARTALQDSAFARASERPRGRRSTTA
jgi:hypothetical protein